MGEPDIAEIYRMLVRIEAGMRELVHRDVYLADREVQAVKYQALDKRVQTIEGEEKSRDDRAASFRNQVFIALFVFALTLVAGFIRLAGS